MSTEYLSPDSRTFIRDNTPANKALITEKRLFTRAQLEDIGGKLYLSKLAKLPSPDMPYAHKFNYHSPGKVQLVDDGGVIFEAMLDSKNQVIVLLPNGKSATLAQLAQGIAA